MDFLLQVQELLQFTDVQNFRMCYYSSIESQQRN